MSYYKERKEILFKITACKKGIGLANKLKTTRKKHQSRLFKNLNHLNKIDRKIIRFIKEGKLP